jgi:equilibrative nucleoside transporter 1/2/3
VATAVFQGGLFGLTGMMPFKYTGAVMTGQGVGGTFAALANIAALFGKWSELEKGLLQREIHFLLLSLSFTL